MTFRRCVVGLVLAALPCSIAHQPDHGPNDFNPSEDVAHRRGPEIFNAVHHAMRQWGSSLHHNGMSFFIATVPEGVLFHHGNSQPESPTEPEWLAYEIEHAEGFARGRRGPGGPGRPPPGGDRPPPGGDDPPPGREEMRLPVAGSGGAQSVMGDTRSHRFSMEEPEEEQHGYLHVYRTTRPLKFLYVDGMAAGKTSMGTLDSQDYLLRGQEPSADNRRMQPSTKTAGGPFDERQRAVDLCKLCDEWGLQGVIRMECGFEIIKCSFADGLEQMQALQRPDGGPDGGGGPRSSFGTLEFLRGLAERYHGIGGMRTTIDYSSMVSALFYPLNLTNPDPKRPDLPRLASASSSELTAVREHIGVMVRDRQNQTRRAVDWQDVSDMIVGRYADRVQFLAEGIDTVQKMQEEINFLLTLYIDGSKSDTEEAVDAAIDRCANFYLKSIVPVTDTDRLILVAFQKVTHEICETLFKVRSLVVADPAPDQMSLADAVSAVRSLMELLRWTRFKRCPACAVDEVCTIPMWPFGTVEQYNSPQCTNGSDIRGGESYWGHRGGPPGGPGGGKDRGPPPLL